MSDEKVGLIGWDKYQIKIQVKTGLHIGGNKNTFEIGAVDNPIIRDGNNKPFIPGSSLKGKIRSLLEKKYAMHLLNKGVLSYDPSQMENLKESLENGVFIKSLENKNIKSLPKNLIADLIILAFGNGTTTKYNLEPLVIFRDLYPEDNKFNLEIKMENSINRVEGTASNRRENERISPGTVFEGEIIIRKNGWGFLSKEQVEELTNKIVELLKEGLRYLEKEYLGGSGTRGYGAVKVFLNGKEIDEEGEDK